MNRAYVSSTDLVSVGYDNGTLEIEFKENNVYQYFNVPQSIYNGLLSAGSKGTYFHSHIKNKYRYRKV